MSEWINAMHRNTKKKKKHTKRVNVAFNVSHGEELKKPLETWVMVAAVEGLIVRMSQAITITGYEGSQRCVPCNTSDSLQPNTVSQC